MTLTILDMEFTGGRPRRDRIVELAMVRIVDGEIVDQFYSVINPGEEVRIKDFLFSLVQFDRPTLEAAPTFGELTEQIIDFSKDSILVGFNIRRQYALLRQECKRTDHKLNLKQIDLTHILNEKLPVEQAKSLTALCRFYAIPFNHQVANLLERCKAVAQIALKLLDDTVLPTNQRQLRSLSLATKFPPNLPPEKVEELPNATGIYYFLNHKGQIIYLGKSKAIRTRILSHFNTDLESAHKQKMKKDIYDIQYRITGSELIALLYESDEIKRFMPRYNRAQRRKKYRFGIYIEPNEAGYLCLKLDYLQLGKTPLVKFTSRWGSIQFLLNTAIRYGFSLELLGIQAFEKWFETSGFEEADFDLEEPMSVAAHNTCVEELIRFYSYPHPNMLIVEPGTHENEMAIILIEENQYKGYTYLAQDKAPQSENGQLSTFEKLTILPKVRKNLIPFRENPDVQGIIRRYLRKNEISTRIFTF